MLIQIKCEQYWLSDRPQSFGEIIVILKEEIVDPHIVIRKLKIAKVSEFAKNNKH